MIRVTFVDDNSIEVVASNGEKFIWKTFFPTSKQRQKYYTEKLQYYYEKYIKENIGHNTGMGMAYWVWIRMNYDEGLGIYGGKGDRDDQKIFQKEQRVRIGEKIRELRKEKNIEAKKLAQIANIDAANLSRIEQGRYSVGLDVLSNIALALGAKIELNIVEHKKS
ncbi:helix-turn-helix domain-containing protein [Formosa sp. L2A11]|uniref:helix-turn-helix domain-containing protein n=1 Tax=Formosa sp. L2A11 TaxID=2686363 RepID=UPI00131D55CD|nr:helix-turn-helix transcriptional regulator [Formosa sp. L2A11]